MHYLYLGDGFEPVAQERTWMGEPPHWTGGPLDPNHPEYIDPDQPSEAYERTHRYYYHVDHIGTPIEVTDEAGHVAWHAQYKAWGEAKEVLSATAKRAGFKNPLRFQGQYHDEESGLHYNRFRYYDPELGRYISEDPIRLRGGLNTYQYAPNPVMWVDPFGLNSCELAKNMENTGVIRPDDTAAHHIVPETAQAAQPARDVLKRVGIDVNGAENGVFLPGLNNTGNTPGILHNGRHPNEYIESVNQRLMDAEKDGGRTGVLQELNNMRNALLTANRNDSWSNVLT